MSALTDIVIINAYNLLIVQLALMGLFLLVGNTFRYTLRNRFEWPHHNGVVSFCFDILLGMALTVVALQWLSFTQVSIFIMFSLLVLSSTTVMIFRICKHFQVPESKRQSIELSISKHVLLLVMLFVIVDFLSFNMVSGLWGSTNADAAYHTLQIETILLNQAVVAQPLPFFEYLLWNPSGPHVLGALVVWLKLAPIQSVVVSLGAVFPALTVLAMYSFMHILTRRNTLSLAAACLVVMGRYFWHPLSFTFTVQMMQFVAIASAAMIASFGQSERSGIRILPFALIFSLAAYIHPAALLFSAILGAPSYLSAVVNRYKCNGSGELKRTLVEMFSVLFLSVILWLPFGIVTVQFMTNSTQGLPIDWIAPVLRETWIPGFEGLGQEISHGMSFVDMLNPARWLSEASRHGGYYVIGPLCIFLAGAAWTLRDRLEHDSLHRDLDGPIIDGIRVTIWMFLSFIMVLFTLSNVVHWPNPFLDGTTVSYLLHPCRVWEMLFIPLAMMTALSLNWFVVFAKYLAEAARRITPQSLHLSSRSSLGKTTMAVALLGLTCTLPFVSAPLYDQNWLGGFQGFYSNSYDNLRLFNLLELEDLHVFNWIENNTDPEAVFLVNQVDAGQYLTSVTNRKSIYPFGPLADTRHYRQLCLGLTVDPSNPYLLELFEYYNISYVFTGSEKASPETPTWENEISRRGVWSKSSLSTSPFLVEMCSYGESALYRVEYDNPEGSGPVVVTLSDLSTIATCETLDDWEIDGVQPLLDPSIPLTGISNSSIVANISANASLIYSPPVPLEIAEIGIWLMGVREYSIIISISDSSGRTLNHSSSLDTDWAFSLMDLKQRDGGLEDIASVSFSLKTTNNSEIELHVGGIFTVDVVSFVRTTGCYSLEQRDIIYHTSFSSSGGLMFLLPGALTLTSLSPEPPVLHTFSNGIVAIDEPTEMTYAATLQNRTVDPRSQVSSSMPRPICLVYETPADKPLIIVTKSSSEISLFSSNSTELICDHLWSSVIRTYKLEPLLGGNLYLYFFFRGWIGERSISVRIHNGTAAAGSRLDPILELTLDCRNVLRWSVVEIPIKNIRMISIRVENLDSIGSLFMSSAWVYSNGLYF